MESLELFGSEVLPEFAERDERQAAEKAKRLEPVIDGGAGPQARLGPPAAADAPTTTFPAIPRDLADRAGPRRLPRSCSTASPTAAAAGGADELQGLLEQDLGSSVGVDSWS